MKLLLAPTSTLLDAWLDPEEVEVKCGSGKMWIAQKGKNFLGSYLQWGLFCFVLFAIFILHSRESELYRYTLDGKSALAWELPFSRFMGHLSST